jgi:hypothetical protein
MRDRDGVLQPFRMMPTFHDPAEPVKEPDHAGTPSAIRRLATGTGRYAQVPAELLVPVDRKSALLGAKRLEPFTPAKKIPTYSLLRSTPCRALRQASERDGSLSGMRHWRTNGRPAGIC